MWNKVLLNRSRILTHSSKSAENFQTFIIIGIQLNVIACFIVNTQIIMKLIFQTNNQMMRVFFLSFAVKSVQKLKYIVIHENGVGMDHLDK